MHTLDLRAALRRILRAPFVAVALALLISLAIGVNTAVFLVVGRVLLADLPFPAADELVRVWVGGREDAPGSVRPTDYSLIADARAHALAAVAAYRQTDVQVGPTGAASVPGLLATASLFEVLQIWPKCVGRDGLAAAAAEKRRILFVGEDYANRHGLGTACGAAQTLIVNGETHQVAGAIPDVFRFLDDEAQILLLFEPQQLRSLENSVLSLRDVHVAVLARLAAGVRIDDARVVLGDSSNLSGVRSVRLMPLKEDRTRHVADSVQLLQVLAIFVLVVTVLNVTQILQANAHQRAREAAIRASLGASLWRCHTGVLADAVLITGAGVAAGVVVHRVALAVLVRYAPAMQIPSAYEEGVDLLAVAALAAAACVLGPLATLVLKVRGYRDRIPSLSQSAASAGGPARRDLTVAQLLLAGQAAVMMAGVVVAVLLVASTSNLLRVDLGFEPGRIVATPLRVAGGAVSDRVERLLTLLSVLESEMAHGAVIASTIPLSRSTTVNLLVHGQTPLPALAQRLDVSTAYFAAMSIDIQRGRTFDAADDSSAPPVVVVSDAFSRTFLDGDGIGRQLRLGTASWTVVGIAGDVRSRGVRSPSVPTVYVHLPQSRVGVLGNRQIMLQRAELIVATSEPLFLHEAAVRELVRRTDPRVTTGTPRLLATLVNRDTEATRFLGGIAFVFAVLTSALGCAAAAAATAQYLALRRTDLAIRLALGASPARARRLVIRVAVLPAGAGVLAGLPLAYIASGLVSGHFFGVDASSWSAYAFSAGVALLGCSLAMLPAAVKGGRLDPARLLRAE
ncbi:MAG: ABC transporter permease [Vicinamibacterales bacterium]